jgi:hypothetical protein
MKNEAKFPTKSNYSPCAYLAIFYRQTYVLHWEFTLFFKKITSSSVYQPFSYLIVRAGPNISGAPVQDKEKDRRLALPPCWTAGSLLLTAERRCHRAGCRPLPSALHALLCADANFLPLSSTF